jgi:hypothetical protein
MKKIIIKEIIIIPATNEVFNFASLSRSSLLGGKDRMRLLLSNPAPVPISLSSLNNKTKS